MSKILQLRGGRQINPKDLELDDIELEPFAHSLSNQCRFLGHCKWHYSNAQHSVLVASIVPNEYKKCALLHDYPEAIWVDVPSLVKQESEFDAYRLIEKYIWSVVAYKHDLPVRMPYIIKQADKAVLYWEAQELMRNDDDTIHSHWTDYSGYAALFPQVEIIQMNPPEAKQLFLDTYYALQDLQ